MSDDTARLTDEELAVGYHFCWDWDGMLVSKLHDPEYDEGYKYNGEWGDGDSCRCGYHIKEPGCCDE